MKIKEILKLDIQEDIKNVIDLQDQSENEIQSEIESYIITDGLGKHLSKFVSEYTGNIKETGVWLSGFYGSGKSYFGKMLGYIIDNKVINGTPARDRFLPRLEGIKNQSLIENDVRRLDTKNSKVIFLDVAKQNTDNGLAFTLFSNFLKSLGFRDDKFGYMEYELFIDGKFEFLKEKAKELLGKEWSVIKNGNREIAKAMRRVYSTMDYSEAEYNDTLQTYEAAISNFSSTKLKDELEKYLVKFPDETLVFIFDEASEAISQKKFNLLDLEAISESLTSISKKVWTIAIAQEKLDDVINNANVSKSNLTKVTDRFKTKIHLDSTEVDVIIRNRLLQKKETAYQELINYFNKHEGLISDATNLKSNFPTKTTSAEQFATYYPFHKYQFDLLQKFLFSSNALVTTQIAARGMIITTFDVLRKELKNSDLYGFTTAHDLCTEAQTSPPADLDNKYKIAEQIIKKADLEVNGEKLLKTIHFINESGELVSPTVENITKAYITDIEKYYEFKPVIDTALTLLTESKVLLLSNNNYKITSNLEGKLLEEMKDFDVELFIKKRELVGYLKKINIFRQVSVINEDAIAYNFNILTDLEDEIIGSSNKQLRLTAYSLFNINEDRQDFIESLKLDTQYNKEVITLVPDNSKFTQIDKLLEEVKRYGYMEEKYNGTEDEKIKPIIRDFSVIKNEKEKDLRNLIEAAYINGSLIYLFDENLVNKDNFKGTTNQVQRKLIKNVYTKRLSSQLSEAVGIKIVNEKDAKKLYKYFSGDEFKFFDANGNFTGDHLKVVEELNGLIKNRYIDGRSLEESLSIAPWGYSYGTLSTALAVLFRAGRLVVKYNDTEYFSHNNKPAHEVFSSGAKFKTARFKSITKALSAEQKNQIVQTLLDLDYENHTGVKIDWNASDFELAEATTSFANHFITALQTLRKTQQDFDKLFGKVANQKDILLSYTSKTTAANYIEKSEDFLAAKKEYSTAIKTIVKAEKFIRRNVTKIKGFTTFVNGVGIELNKAGIKNQIISENTLTFNEAIKKDVIEQFSDIQTAAQNVKDEYFKLMDSNAKSMSAKYEALKENVLATHKVLKDNYPPNLNVISNNKLKALHKYCEDRILKGVRLEYQIMCQDSNYFLSDILNYIDLVASKELELQMIKGDFVKEAPKPKDPKEPKAPKKLELTITKKVMTAKEYKALLATQLQAMAGMDNDDEIDLTVISN
jgi:hypothetical protein